MFQGYGLSEATPVISTNSPKYHWHKFGSSGKILEPLDLKILDEEGRELPRGQKGEIVIRGENVMAGYWKNPDATAATVRNGWLHTGDMGYVSEDDFLYVLGRFKSLLIASDGEKYSPEGMEEAIVDKSPFIDQIIIYNNQSPFTGAIVVPNRDALRRELDARDIREGRAAAAADILGAEIDRYRAGGPYAGEISRAVASGGTGYRGRAIHRAKRTDQQYDENRPQQGGRVFPRPDRLPLYSGGKGVAKR